jgi:hypothetical protein
MVEVKVSETWLRTLFTKGARVPTGDGAVMEVVEGLHPEASLALMGITRSLGEATLTFHYHNPEAWRAEQVVLFRRVEPEAAPAEA